MTEIAWYPFYVGDYARKTAHLSLLEHGAYRLLLDHYYATRHPLPNDPAKLYRICRARSPSERKAVLSVIAEFFTEDGTLMRSEKCDSEIGKQLKYSDSQSAKAKLRHSTGTAAALPRARKPHSQSQNSGAKAPSLPPTPLPDWVPSEEWKAFKDMRQRMRAPLNENAERLLIGQLDKLRADGQEAKAVIEQSIMRGWRGFFAVKTEQAQKGRSHGKHSKFAEQDYTAGTEGFITS